MALGHSPAQEESARQLGINVYVYNMVMAHEMGHMMGLHSHSLTGIMRAGWRSEDYALANQRALLFTPRQGELVRRQVRALAQEHTTAELATARASK